MIDHPHKPGPTTPGASGRNPNREEIRPISRRFKIFNHNNFSNPIQDSFELFGKARREKKEQYQKFSYIIYICNFTKGRNMEWEIYEIQSINLHCEVWDVIGTTTGGMNFEIITDVIWDLDKMILERLHFTKYAGDRLTHNQIQECGRDLLKKYGRGASELVVRQSPRTTGASGGKGLLRRPIRITLESKR